MMSDGEPRDVENSPLVVNGIYLDVTPNNIPSKPKSDMSTISSTFSDVSLGNSGCKPGDSELGVPGDVKIKPVALDFNSMSMSPSPPCKGHLLDSDLETPAKDDFGNGPGSSGMSMVSRGLKRSLDTSSSSGGDILVTPKKKTVKTMEKAKIEIDLGKPKSKVTKDEKEQLSRRTVVDFFNKMRESGC